MLGVELCQNRDEGDAFGIWNAGLLEPPATVVNPWGFIEAVFLDHYSLAMKLMGALPLNNKCIHSKDKFFPTLNFCIHILWYQLLSVTDVNTRNTKEHATYNRSLPISLKSTVNSYANP